MYLRDHQHDVVASVGGALHESFESNGQAVPSYADKDKALVRRLIGSTAFCKYRDAFSRATGLPLSLEPKDGFGLAHIDDSHQSPFCVLLAAHHATCAELLILQKLLEEKAQFSSVTICSRYGINQTAVPVKLGERLIGYLHTGQVFFRRANTRQAQRVLRQLRNRGLSVRKQKFLEAYGATPVIERCVYRGIVVLVEFFAAQLSAIANHVVLQDIQTLPVPIARACEFIADHYDEELRLSALADHLGLSPFAFCKRFKQATAVTFKEYLARLRVEKAKDLLLDSRYRISEAAYECGFQSLSNFNRHFRRITGQSPTDFRRKQCSFLGQL